MKQLSSLSSPISSQVMFNIPIFAWKKLVADGIDYKTITYMLMNKADKPVILCWDLLLLFYFAMGLPFLFRWFHHMFSDIDIRWL